MNHRHLLYACLAACACGGSKDPAPQLPTSGGASPAAAAPAKPVENTTLKAVGLDPDSMDTTADACTDFYQLACGGWIASTQIPADKSRYGRFTEIYERNEETLHSILEEARTGKLTSPIAQKIGSFYGACMDEDAVEKAGVAPIRPLLKSINTKNLAATIANLHQHKVRVLFHFDSTPDFKDATRVIGEISQSGLGLPDRDYYLSKDKRFEDIRKAYVDHVQAMMALSGMSKAKAAAAAKDVMAVEMEIAKASLSREKLRDPQATYNKIDRDGVAKLAPAFDWNAYYKGMGIAEVKDITVQSKSYVERMSQLIAKDIKPAQWKNYFTWQVLDSTASLLPKKFVDQNFAMSQKLSGAKELPVRWKRCTSATDSALGELLAQPFLDRRFGPEAKKAADEMVQGISQAFRESVADLEWMSPETRAKAAAKQEKMAYLIGYPEKWRKYDWKVDKAYAGNVLASRQYEVNRELKKIGKPYDRSEWYMSPPTVNAYYNPLANQMVFPAGILQPPFFSAEASVPVNLGAMGMVVGHELTHGFDDSGAQFDGDGNLNDWWEASDKEAFSSRGECVAKQYSNYEPIPGVKINGKLTLGENIADMGGVKLAFMAYRNMRAKAAKTMVADGYTEDQQFFLAVGQAWCNKAREEELRRRVVTDPHSMPKFRVIGALSNLPEFAEAFQCKAGSAMAPENSCQVW
jgi:predicted metalloendopeptidase